jgi:hypothetical protein
MKITTDRKTFNEAVMNTPIGAVCVKKRGKKLDELFKDEYGHGILVSPTVVKGMVRGPDELEWIIMEINEPDAMVRGHGWAVEVPFVWTGTRDEFNATWVID